ncbi:complex I NDUFA9 subunit family protein [Roseovarius indicus]|uniref:3-beta hydroxysteroid dehydrogenase n=1 Tax=Roseovarius indicus TaxID=540747 RepID=A0A0T5PEE9_9RHOB|nr:complex I NDUFA9 subunit family protein [Roseovarius indicus]KRS19384.1 3-beta hydroxysteroid dehydrogenase [Roseovarius indicus]QEW29311.1 hopanoid-associated sugar epimerase [Roseovarius indicus]SFD76330.1 NADH dehydrogenase [Roseovarius indicus]
MPKSKLVTIFGGSGFLGRYIARRMAKAGWRVRVAVRRPNDAVYVRTYGVVGQVEPVFCNIRDDDSVRSVMRGTDAAVNCVGTFEKGGKNNFDAIQHKAAARVARIAREEGVQRLVHISAIGADTESDTLYGQSKGQGEAAILESFPDATILRPSVIFGAEDAFFNRFAGMSRFGPILPVVGASSRFQPVWVDDVAAAAEMGAKGTAAPGIYELGGPDVNTFRELMQQMLGVIHRRRLILNIPFWIATIMGAVMEFVQAITFRLIPPQITRDQVQSLKSDNVVSEGAKTFADLGIEPTSLEAVLPDYLWRFRPDGQYDDIKRSASNLRGA